jgi:hypothetical protein
MHADSAEEATGCPLPSGVPSLWLDYQDIPHHSTPLSYQNKTAKKLSSLAGTLGAGSDATIEAHDGSSLNALGRR